jgi:small subunit ribosomal protein S8
MMTDPVGDMLTRIRNAGRAKHAQMRCPSSKLKVAVARVLSREGFVGEVRVESEGSKPVMVVDLRYRDTGSIIIDGIRRVSRPGRRVYVGSDQIPRIRNGLGIAVLSTSKGVLCDRDAREANVGGEMLCEVW